MGGSVRELALALLGASLALSAAIAWLVLADRRVPRPWAHTVAALAASGAAYSLLCAGRLSEGAEAWQTVWRTLAAPGAALLWRLLRQLFDADFRPRCVERALPWLLAALPLTVLATDWAPARRAAHVLMTAMAVACVVHGVWRVAAGRADDLDEPRRRLRLLLAGLASAYVVFALVVHRTRLVDPATAVAVLLAAQAALKAFALRLLAGEGNPLLPRPPGPASTPAATAAAPAVPAVAPAAALSAPNGDALARRITAAMAAEHLYRRPGLTVKGLAEHLQVPEYRVRQSIVQTLGHHHFSAFVNSYRLDEVATRLRSPRDAGVAITTLALDAGFGSLGPFNRAFRERFGRTPTEFRATPAR